MIWRWQNITDKQRKSMNIDEPINEIINVAVLFPGRVVAEPPVVMLQWQTKTSPGFWRIFDAFWRIFDAFRGQSAQKRREKTP